MKAFVLAAGKGERLRPLTENHPKPLLKVHGKPLLAHVLDRLEAAGFEHVVVNAWYYKEQIIRFVEQQASTYSFRLEVSEEDELLGTGGGLRQAMPLLGDAPFLVLNADCLWKGDLRRFIEQAQNSGFETSWMLVSERKDQTRIGCRASEVVQIGDLWKKAEPESFSCFSGIQWFNQLVHEDLEEKSCLIRSYLLKRLEKGARIGGLFGDFDFWEDLGTPERFRQVEAADSPLLSEDSRR